MGHKQQMYVSFCYHKYYNWEECVEPSSLNFFDHPKNFIWIYTCTTCILNSTNVERKKVKENKTIEKILVFYYYIKWTSVSLLYFKQKKDTCISVNTVTLYKIAVHWHTHKNYKYPVIFLLYNRWKIDQDTI